MPATHYFTDYFTITMPAARPPLPAPSSLPRPPTARPRLTAPLVPPPSRPPNARRALAPTPPPSCLAQVIFITVQMATLFALGWARTVGGYPAALGLLVGGYASVVCVALPVIAHTRELWPWQSFYISGGY